MIFLRLRYLSIILAASTSAQERKINVKIEQYNFCPNIPTLAKININETYVKMSYTGLEIVGRGVLTEDLTRPMSVMFKSMKCENQNSCVDENLTILPEFCKFVKSLPFFNVGLGNFFTPKLKCPIKRGEYHINISSPMTRLGMFPLGTALRKLKLIVFETTNSNKQRNVVCLSGLIRTQAYTKRKH